MASHSHTTFRNPFTRNHLHQATAVPVPPTCHRRIEMEHATPLTSIQQQVVDTLAAGASLSYAAETHHVYRIPIYRWMKTIPQFKAVLELERAEFILARRNLQNRQNILERNKSSKPGWCVAEPYPTATARQSSTPRPSNARPTASPTPISLPTKKKSSPNRCLSQLRNRPGRRQLQAHPRR